MADLKTANRLVFMVTAAMFINYVDRGNLATAAPLMQSDTGLSPEQLGILMSAFYYGYVPLMPATGWLAERYGAKAVLAAGVTRLGENRLQDLQAKRAVAGDALAFDFIGHLQRRKVRAVLPEVRLIHSVDSAELAGEIARRAEGDVRVLVERIEMEDARDLFRGRGRAARGVAAGR